MDILKDALPFLKTAFWPVAENNFRPVFLQKRFLVYYFFVFLLARLVIFPFYFLFPGTSFFAEVVSTTLVELTNQERQTQGLLPLKVSSVLNQAALAKAQDMLAKDYFAHTSPQGLSPWYWFKKAGYNYQVAGENLAIGFVDSEEVAKAWEVSSTHRQNLLEPSYREIGVAVVKGSFQGKETTLVVQFFGTPQAKPAVPKPVVLTPSPSPSAEKTPVPSSSPLFSPQAVLAGQEENSVVWVQAEENQAGLPENILSFGANRYDELTSRLLNFFLLFLIGGLLLTLAISLKKGVKSLDLIFGTAAFVFLFFVSNFLDKQMVISLIPHQLVI